MDGKMSRPGDREPKAGDSVVWSRSDAAHGRHLIKKHGEGPHVVAEVSEVEYANGGRMKFEIRLHGVAGEFHEELLEFI